MKDIRTRTAGDEGMTIVEVLISATILFIVLTAILALVLQTMNTGNQSKRQTVFTNAVNSYVERVQAMPFDEVAFAADGGTLAPSETMTIDGYTVVITPTITPGATTDLKKLVVSASISAPNGETTSSSLDVVVRDKLSFLTKGVNGPVVSWSSVMPESGEVVWGTTKASGGVLWLGATATATEGETISRVTITADNGWALENTIGTPAVWDFDADEREETWTLTGFAWNTEQEGIIDAETLEVAPVIPDGLRTIKLNVTDSAGGVSELIYTLIVDNHAPSDPGVPVLGLAQAGPVAEWEPSSDGTDEAAAYTVGMMSQMPTGAWTARTESTVSASGIALEPFGRYMIDVTAVGVDPVPATRGPRTSDMVSTIESLIAPPKAAGTRTVAGKNKNRMTYHVSFSASEPQFQVAGTPTYTWYASGSASGPWTTQVANTRSVTDLSFSGETYYRCRVTLKPGSSTSGPTMEFWSNVLGPTSTDRATAVPLGEHWVQ